MLCNIQGAVFSIHSQLARVYEMDKFPAASGRLELALSLEQMRLISVTVTEIYSF